MHGDDIKSFQDLECWKACREVRLFVSREVMVLLPTTVRFRLGDQLVRASRSATANIAEGYGRFHFLDNAKFCSNSRGSCWEVLDHLIAARDEGFISTETFDKGAGLVQHAVKVLNGYIHYLQRASKSSSVHEDVGVYSTAFDEPITDN